MERGGFKDPAGVWVRIVYRAKEFNKAVCTEQKMTTVLWGHCLLFTPKYTGVCKSYFSKQSGC